MTAVDARPSVVAVLRAVGKAGLTHLLPEEEARLLTGPVARAEAGAPFSREQETAAARLLQASCAILGPPLAHLGVTIPPAPAPVGLHPTRSVDAAVAPVLRTIAGGSIAVYQTPYALRELMLTLPGRSYGSDTGGRRCWLLPATPAAAAAVMERLAPFGPRASPAVLALVARHAAASVARAGLADDAPVPVDDGTGYVNMPLWTHQRRAVEFGAESAGMMFAAKMGPTWVGTPVLTPSGWRKIGELAGGDEVFGRDGRPVRIREVRHYGAHQLYRVTLNDGTSTTCTAEHRWTVTTPADRGKGRERILSLAQMLDMGICTGHGRGQARFALPEQPVLEFGHDIDLAVLPYALGALLGDGALGGASPTLCTPDLDICERVAAELAPLGVDVARFDYPGRCGGIRLIGRRPEGGGMYPPNPLHVALRGMGLDVGSHDKFIPPAYLTASVVDRVDLLRGLLDTDGSPSVAENRGAGGVEYATVSSRLAEDVAFLARSLGIRVRVTSRHTTCQTGTFFSYRLALRVPAGLAVFWCARKTMRFVPSRYRVLRTVKSVDPDRVDDVCCIELDVSPDSSSVYLQDTSLILTNNSGKTATIIALANKIRAGRVLVVAPNRVRRVWTREVRERSSVAWHIVDGSRPKKVGRGRVDLPQPERVVEATRVLYDCDCGAPVHAYALNYEALGLAVWQRWVPPEPLDLIVYDEAHRLSNHLQKHRRKVRGLTVDELRKRNARDLPKWTVSGIAGEWRANTRRVVAATGTPMPQHPWQIFGIYRAIDPGIFGTVWTQFRDRYVELDRTGTYPRRIKPEMMAEFAAKVMLIMYRPTVDLDLPGCSDVARTVELEPEARRVYDQLDTELWADLTRMLARQRAVRDGRPVADEAECDGAPAELTAANILSRLLRLQQLTGGTLRTDPVAGPDGLPVPGPEVRVSTAKADLLADLLDEVGCVASDGRAAGHVPEPVVVFTRFTSDLRSVRGVVEKAGLRYAEISGNRGDGLDEDARMTVDADVVGVNVQAGGTGIDLTRARYGIWYSLGYSVSDYDQARARMYRPGQTRPVVYIHIQAEDTADEAVYAAISARREAISEVLRAGGVEPEQVGVIERDPGPAPSGGASPDSGNAAVRFPWER